MSLLEISFHLFSLLSAISLIDRDSIQIFSSTYLMESYPLRHRTPSWEVKSGLISRLIPLTKVDLLVLLKDTVNAQKSQAS